MIAPTLVIERFAPGQEIDNVDDGDTQRDVLAPARLAERFAPGQEIDNVDDGSRRKT